MAVQYLIYTLRIVLSNQLAFGKQKYLTNPMFTKTKKSKGVDI